MKKKRPRFGPDYERGAQGVWDAIVAWHKAHPGVDCGFRFPPDTALIGVLVDMPRFPLVDMNDNGRALIAYICERVPGATMFMLQALYERHQRLTGFGTN